MSLRRPSSLTTATGQTPAPDAPAPRRRAPFVIATLACAFVSLALTATPASAAFIGHEFSTSFGAASSTPANPYPLSNPYQLAVDQSTGDVYVSDPANFRVEKFTPSGEFLLMFGKGVNKTAVEHGGTEAERDLCTAQLGETCQPGTEGASPGAFDSVDEYPAGKLYLAVDNSPGGEGDVYVGDSGDSVVSKFDSTGHLISTWGSEGQLSFTAVKGIAVDPSGTLFVAGETTGEGFHCRLERFAPTGTRISIQEIESQVTYVGLAIDSVGHLYYDTDGQTETAIEGSEGTTFFPLRTLVHIYAPTGLAIDLADHDSLYVALEQNTNGPREPFISQFTDGCPEDRETEGCDPFDTFGAGYLGHLPGATGVAVDEASNTVYATNSEAGTVAVFRPILVPNLTVESPTHEAPTSITLNAEVEPEGGDVTECRFEYGTKAGSYGLGSVPCAPDPASNPPGFSAITQVSALLTGLIPATTYHYRLTATNAAGHTIHTPDHNFTPVPDPPAVIATSFSHLTPTSVTLESQINPGLGATVYLFEYGSDASYGSATLPSASIGSDQADHPVSTEVAGLTPATTYHYRAVAINLAGTAYGSDQTFTTPGPPLIGAVSSTAVTETTATLRASINPEFAATTYRVEYGTAASYGQSVPQSASLAADGAAHEVSAPLIGLTPATTYHFRFLATNAVGTAAATDQTFTTAAAPPPPSPPPAGCKPGYLRRHGRCAKKHHRKNKHHKKNHQSHAGTK